MKTYFILAIILAIIALVTILAFIDPILPALIVPFLAGVLCIPIQKKNPVITGIVAATVVNILCAIFFFVAKGAGSFTESVLSTAIIGSIVDIITSIAMGLCLGILYKFIMGVKVRER